MQGKVPASKSYSVAVYNNIQGVTVAHKRLEDFFRSYLIHISLLILTFVYSLIYLLFYFDIILLYVPVRTCRQQKH